MVIEALNNPTAPDQPRQNFAIITTQHRIKNQGSEKAHVISAGTVVRIVSAAPNKMTQHIKLRQGHATVPIGQMHIGDIHQETANAAEKQAPSGHKLADLETVAAEHRAVRARNRP